MKKFLEKYLIGQMVKSKKFWYAVSSVVVPAIVTYLGVDETTARESATRDYLHLLVQDVPDRDWILFHRGNTTKDTRGCILVGQSREQDRVNNSRLAMDLIVKEILNLGGENINLIIKNK